MDNKNLQSVRCSGCGRFLGLALVNDGEVYLFCRCKSWAAVLGPPQEKVLTGEQINKRITENIPLSKGGMNDPPH